MIVRRLFDERLAHSSYLIGCEKTGAAIVVDPNMDVDRYVEAAESDALSISHVTETHIHADFLSGTRALATRAGAEVHLSREGDGVTGYDPADSADVAWVGDGASIQVGSVRLDVLHTPGHTPEHLTFLVVDTLVGESPVAALTGDFVFVGDVGRPDLLERVSEARGSFEKGARDLHAAIRRFLALPDYVQIWPAHGAGSACGRQLSAVPASTVGYERLYNWALQTRPVEAFIAEIVRGQPDVPAYFGEMKRRNRMGGGTGLDDDRPRIPVAQLDQLLEGGALVVDLRSPELFAAGHRTGTVNIPLEKGFTTWAGSVLPYDTDVFLLGGSEAELKDAYRELQLIGFERVSGFFGERAAAPEEDTKTEAAAIRRVDVTSLKELMRTREIVLLDVRSTGEWEAGHIRGARHVPLSDLRDVPSTLPRDTPVVVHCESGSRSSIAASLLEREGVPQVFDFYEGYSAWIESFRDAP